MSICARAVARRPCWSKLLRRAGARERPPPNRWPWTQTGFGEFQSASHNFVSGARTTWCISHVYTKKNDCMQPCVFNNAARVRHGQYRPAVRCLRHLCIRAMVHEICDQIGRKTNFCVKRKNIFRTRGCDSLLADVINSRDALYLQLQHKSAGKQYRIVFRFVAFVEFIV